MQGRLVHLRLLTARLALLLVLLLALRLVFYLAYRHVFPGLPLDQALQVLLQGVRFDLATVTLWNAPFILFHLLPLPWRNTRAAQRALFTWFMVVNGLLFLICSIDLAFFGFNMKRVGRDLLGQAGPGLRNLPALLADHGWVVAVFGLIMFVLWKAYPRLRPDLVGRPRWGMESVAAVLGLALFFVAGRGGWQYQGLSPVSAADHVDVPYSPLVTNSAFTFLYSLAQPELQQHRYFTDVELDRRMPLRYRIRREAGDRKENVVLIVVESLGREYISAISGEAAYMPFLDSLAGESLIFENAFANAERSNKGICAVLGGVPSLMDDAFMNTAYADNRVEGLGRRLKQYGYSTSFFHGGFNGEYKFDSFSRAAGFDRYFGRDQYPDPAGYDGHWGIYDEEFLQFMADRLDHEQKPFGAALFTLTSHHPFPIPARWQGHFPKGDQEIHESLGYVDMALRQFFRRAAQSDWYRNTLFVITADHTYPFNVHPPWYTNPAGRFAAPIIFFRPDGSLKARSSELAQQLDIIPSILDLVGFEGEINTFGRSLIKDDRVPYAIQFVNGQYQMIQGDRMLFFNGEKATGLFAYLTDTLFKEDLRLEEPATVDTMQLHMQAVIQRFGQAVRDNQMALP